MTNSSDTQLQSIDNAILTPLVRQALRTDTAQVTSWDIHQVHGGAHWGAAGGSAAYRLAGRP
jgi:hypothetical protein